MLFIQLDKLLYHGPIKTQQLFEPQIQAIADAYMAWSHDAAHTTVNDAGLPSNDNSYYLKVYDVFGESISIHIFYPF